MSCHAMHTIQDLFLEGFSYVLQIDMHFICIPMWTKFYSCKKWVLHRKQPQWSRSTSNPQSSSSSPSSTGLGSQTGLSPTTGPNSPAVRFKDTARILASKFVMRPLLIQRVMGRSREPMLKSSRASRCAPMTAYRSMVPSGLTSFRAHYRPTRHPQVGPRGRRLSSWCMGLKLLSPPEVTMVSPCVDKAAQDQLRHDDVDLVDKTRWQASL
jgi:hypothetical protein